MISEVNQLSNQQRRLVVASPPTATLTLSGGCSYGEMHSWRDTNFLGNESKAVGLSRMNWRMGRCEKRSKF
ncbi:hypothetical protein DdX_15665 [Ditylenchus destructor]|uniref:Uncharacterized protein n=1 Tax=Ditylenchus destructor TaxID=166010 RepID=A0AAD4R0T3_9BILA|nr:hypothetical protein DdX_15665 [Ditylenchus destructor]